MYKEYKMNPQLKKTPIKTQDPLIRARNFEEVTLGYTEEETINEAKRCIGCPNTPCVNHCPVKISIPEFIHEVALGNFEKAYEIISKSSSLPAVCGRVCPQENQCEMKCTRGIKEGAEPVAIGRLERFVADYHNKNNNHVHANIIKNGHKVGIIGSGPSGLACASDLIKLGYDVTIFEALHLAGGVLVYGIPEFRLSKEIVNKEIESLKELGVKIECNVVIGRTLTIDELVNEYGFEALFIGSGAGLPRFMGIKGENLKGVFSANEFLTRVNLMKAYKDNSETPVAKSSTVAVVGGGNVAMDAARTALRLGAKKVYIVYRRSMDELPARKEEVEHAIEEGIEFRLLNNPVEIIPDENNDHVHQLKIEKMVLGEPDASGRRKPVGSGEYYNLDVDSVIMAIGTSPNPLISSTTNGLEVNKHGCLVTRNELGLTTRDRIFAGGDAVTGAATVILAMGAGKEAAKAINELFVK